MSQNGKGHAPRPFSISYEKFSENIERSLNISSKYNISDMTEERLELELFEGYVKLLKSGMLFELYPELTGDWKTDKHNWYAITLTEDSQIIGVYDN